MLDRAAGALIGAAIGDAMGMPASFMTPAQIQRSYGRIDGFLRPDAPEQWAHGALQAGSVTDDTQETEILSQCLIECGGFSRERFCELMRRWAIEQSMLESTVIGPSTRRFLQALVDGGDPSEHAGKGDTNGSIMRVAPVGVFYHGDVDAAVEAALQSSEVSHRSRQAMAGAAAVAAAVALCVQGGYSPEQVIDAAMLGARRGEARGEEIAGASTAARIELARRIVQDTRGTPIETTVGALVDLIGAGMKANESAPFSLGVFYAVGGDARQGVIAAVNAGDDADTNGSIVGALCGAYSGAGAFPEEWVEQIARGSAIDFMGRAKALLRI